MRKILSKEEEQKKRRRNQFIVGGILVLLMLLSTVGYAFQGNSPQQTSGELNYNGYKFIPQSGFWTLQLGDFFFRFSYNPEQVENIPGEFNVISSYSGKPLYISSYDGLAESEIYANLDQVILRRQYACLEGEVCDGGLPVKTCSDNFIIIKESNITDVRQEENCVFIQGPRDDLASLTDSFLYKTIGVK